jgi:hypothetical protein
MRRSSPAASNVTRWRKPGRTGSSVESKRSTCLPTGAPTPKRPPLCKDCGRLSCAEYSRSPRIMLEKPAPSQTPASNLAGTQFTATVVRAWLAKVTTDLPSLSCAYPGLEPATLLVNGYSP